MAANISPIFVLTGFGSPVSFSGSCTDFTGTTTAGLTTVITGGANGSRVTGIKFNVTGTLGAPTLILIFHRSGATYRLYDVVQCTPFADSQTPSNTVPPFTVTWTNPNPGPLKNGDIFTCAQYSGSLTWHAVALGGDY